MHALYDVFVTGSFNGIPLFFSNQGLIAAVQDADETTLKYFFIYLFVFLVFLNWCKIFVFM